MTHVHTTLSNAGRKAKKIRGDRRQETSDLPAWNVPGDVIYWQHLNGYAAPPVLTCMCICMYHKLTYSALFFFSNQQQDPLRLASAGQIRTRISGI